MKSLKAKIYTALGFDSLKPWQIEIRLIWLKGFAIGLSLLVVVLCGNIYFFKSNFDKHADGLLNNSSGKFVVHLQHKLDAIETQTKKISDDIQRFNNDLKISSYGKEFTHEKQTYLRK